jgi:hypothetical protein
MDFLFNDCSIHGQFNACEEFVQAADSVLAIRMVIKREGHEVYCHRSLAGASVTSTLSMQEAVQKMPRDTRRIWMAWLTNGGPFWDEHRQHQDDEWLEVEQKQLVTDTAIGEAGYCCCNSLARELVSVSPSDWLRNPITVAWHVNDEMKTTVDVPNHWTIESVQERLSTIEPTFDSWDSLEQHLRATCYAIEFSTDFLRLKKYPYVKSVADWINVLIQAINTLSNGVDVNGQRTREAELTYETYFTGAAPYCTDESQTNKTSYKSKMTFPHPGQPGVNVFCPWHGKVNSPRNFPPIRIHFSWPIHRSGSVIVPYVGKKITMD